MTTDAEVYDALKLRVEVNQSGTRKFYNVLDQLHREDGPAVEYARSGGTYWFLFGVRHSRLQHQRKVKEIKRAVT